jgi:hypothetical protein
MRSSAISSALITKLLADATLMALTPDGVFYGVAGPSMAVAGATAKRFVIVSLVTCENVPVFGRRSHQHALYLVEARILSSSVANALTRVHDAAERIDALLDPQPPAAPATLTIPGYTLMGLSQNEPTEDIEFDDADASIQWNRCGGRYDVWAAPIAA